MKPNFQQLHELVAIARRQGFADWAERLEEQIDRLEAVFA